MNRFKVMTALLAVVMCMGMSGCGDDSSNSSSSAGSKAESSAAENEATTEAVTEPATEAATGAEQVWGAYSVYVPAGFTLKSTSFLYEDDPRYFSVRKAELDYFNFSQEESEEKMMEPYNYNKKTYTNGQFDVEGTYGGIKWTGFQYDAYGIPGFEAYTTIDGTFLRVSCASFAFDDEITKSILGSIKLAPEGSTTAAADSEKTAETTAETEPTVEVAQKVELKGVTIGIPKGYTVVKDSAPRIYLVENDETGGRVNFSYSSDNAEKQLDKEMGTLDGVEKQEWEIGGKKWVGYTPYENCYCLAGDTSEGSIMLHLDYGQLEELEMLLSLMEFK